MLNNSHPFSAPSPSMGIRLILLVALILNRELQSVKGAAPHWFEGRNDCCPFITVDVGGDNANLTGEYNLKDDKGFKPEDVCINGCIYTKEGSPSTDEYCFKTDNTAVADVKCPVGTLVCNTFL